MRCADMLMLIQLYGGADIDLIRAMSVFGGKAIMTVCRNPLSRSLFGVKRTWPIAAQMSAYDP